MTNKAEEFRTKDVELLKQTFSEAIFEYYKGLLQASTLASMHSVLLNVAKQIPYIQTCTCQSYPTGQAEDCHEHNQNPRHFIGDFNFPCTCAEQGISR
jgi:hypothetical protein